MSEFICECGKELKTKNAYISHRKFCDKTDIEPEGNFKCECGENFQGKGALKSHRLWCDETDEEAPPTFTYEKIECPECDSLISEAQFEKHKNSKACQNGGKFETLREGGWRNYNDGSFYVKEEWKIGDDQYKCPECSDVFSKRGICTHIWRKHTEEGQNFIGHEWAKERGPWNKGLTKKDHPSLKKAAQKLSKRYTENPESHPFYGGSHTEEFKEKMSKHMSKFYEENPEKHPNRVLAGNRSEMTYPEKLVANELEEKDINFEHNKRVLKYYPDFLLKDYGLIIEVDGKRWHSSDEQKEYDRQRDEELKEQGYQVYRIGAKNVLDNFKKLVDKLHFNSN